MEARVPPSRYLLCTRRLSLRACAVSGAFVSSLRDSDNRIGPSQVRTSCTSVRRPVWRTHVRVRVHPTEDSEHTETLVGDAPPQATVAGSSRIHTLFLRPSTHTCMYLSVLAGTYHVHVASACHPYLSLAYHSQPPLHTPRHHHLCQTDNHSPVHVVPRLAPPPPKVSSAQCSSTARGAKNIPV